MELQEIKLKNGSVLIGVSGYCGETDFYAMYDVIQSLLKPEHITYGVDSMCVDGSFTKDGLTVRMSSESVMDSLCFQFSGLSPEDEEKVRDWIRQIAAELHDRLPR